MRRLFLILACAAVALGCSSNGSSSSSGSSGSSGSSTGSTGASGSSGSTGNPGPTPCSSDAQCTGGLFCSTQSGSGICVAPCSFDDQCPASTRCDASTQHCVAAAACDDSIVTSPLDACLGANVDAGYCGGHCRCDNADAGPGPGVCKRVRATCAPCDAAAECDPCPEGASDCRNGNFPATCAAVGDAGSFCLRTTSAQGCPFGYIQDPASGTCQPSSGSCANPGCSTDQDCVDAQGAGHFCDPATGACKEYCTFDYNTGTSQNCPPNQVCNVSPQFVLPDAGTLRYGSGTCGAPCTGDGDCTAIAGSSGLTYACVHERGGEDRCRPVSLPDAGGCMNDVECPDEGVYAGWCSLFSFSCNETCRAGQNPATSQPYASLDCNGTGEGGSYKCVASACELKNCIDEGGAQAGAQGQFCCGEDRDGTGYTASGFADLSHPANACPAGVDAGDFYVAPAPPWCDTGCVPDSTLYADGGFAPLVTCADPSIPNFDPKGSPSFCIQANPNHVACVIPAARAQECPRSWALSGLDVACQTDDDCQEQYLDGGASTSGHCNVFPDGGGTQTCACTQSETADDGGYFWGGECPNQTRCDTQAAHGLRSCIITKGCTPNAAVCGG